MRGYDLVALQKIKVEVRDDCATEIFIIHQSAVEMKWELLK